MGEPRRWVLVEVEPAAIAVWPHMSPEAQAAVRSPMPTRTVREDQATEAEKSKIADWLEERYGSPVRDHIGEWGGREEWGAEARELLDLVFGEEASRV